MPLSAEQLQAAVNLRQARQLILDREREPLGLTVLLADGVLRDIVGDPEVMADQLDHLIARAACPNIELRFLGQGRAVSALGGFELLYRRDDARPFMACTGDVGGVRYHEDPDVVAKFDIRFDHLLRTARTADATLECIHDIRKSHPS